MGPALDEALKYCEDLLKREDERAAGIESKAFTLIAIAGVATAFITSFGALLLDRGKIVHPVVLIAGSVLYLLTASSLLFTIYIAIHVVIIIRSYFARPDPDDILDLPKTTLDDFKRERIASLFYSYKKNTRLVNEKGTYLGGAQLWFRNSVVLLLLLTFVLAAYSPFSLLLPVQTTPTLQPTMQSPAVPTVTAAPTPLPTGTPVPLITQTPTGGTIGTPTELRYPSP